MFVIFLKNISLRTYLWCQLTKKTGENPDKLAIEISTGFPAPHGAQRLPWSARWRSLWDESPLEGRCWSLEESDNVWDTDICLCLTVMISQRQNWFKKCRIRGYLEQQPLEAPPKTKDPVMGRMRCAMCYVCAKPLMTRKAQNSAVSGDTRNKGPWKQS